MKDAKGHGSNARSFGKRSAAHQTGVEKATNAPRSALMYHKSLYDQAQKDNLSRTREANKSALVDKMPADRGGLGFFGRLVKRLKGA